MGEYRIFFKKSVFKDLKSIPSPHVKLIMDRIHDLGHDPRPPGSQKLTGQERYRLRQGPYRIIYSIQDHELTIWVVKVGHRKDIYR